jgi:hypothetical protein
MLSNFIDAYAHFAGMGAGLVPCAKANILVVAFRNKIASVSVFLHDRLLGISAPPLDRFFRHYSPPVNGLSISFGIFSHRHFMQNRA